MADEYNRRKGKQLPTKKILPSRGSFRFEGRIKYKQQ